MARVQYTDVVINRAGRPQPNVAVSIVPVPGSTGTNTLWAAETGGAVLLSLLTDSNGVFSVWLDEGRYDISPDGAEPRRIEIISEAAVGNPPYINARDFGAKGEGGDDTAAIQAALHAAAELGEGKLAHALIPYGAYHISATLVVPDHVSLIGPPLTTRYNATLYHYFDGDLLSLGGSNALENLDLQNVENHTGTAISGVLPTNESKGFLTFSRIIVTGPTPDGGWERDVVIDGTLAVGPTIGYRSIFFKDCQFFGSLVAGETVVLKRVVHCFFNSTEIIRAPMTTTIPGIKIIDPISEDVHFSGCNFDGSFYSESAGSVTYEGRIHQERTITCAPGSKNNIFIGDIDRTSFVNEGDASNRVEGGRTRSVRVKTAVTHALVSATPAALAWELEDFSTDAGMHSIEANTSRLVCTRAGKHALSANVVFAANANGGRGLSFRKNGITYVGGHHGAPNPDAVATTVSATTVVDLVAGDYIEVVVSQGSGGGLNVIPNDSELGIPTNATMHRLA